MILSIILNNRFGVTSEKRLRKMNKENSFMHGDFSQEI